MRTVTVKVSGSTSNLGPGFDCLGVALGIYNWITVTKPTETPAPGIEDQPMCQSAARAFFERAGIEPFAFGCGITGNVPASRGLGSSVTLRAGVVTGLNALSGDPLSRHELFEIAARLEGHPDNAAPAQFGGFTVAGGGSGSEVLRFPVSRKVSFVLLIPDFEIRTEDARILLPQSISRREAVASSARACRITAAFAARRYDALVGAFEDSAFHEPHRLPLIPMLPAVIRAATQAGALGGFLSGSGSTIACLTLRDPGTVAEAMRRAAGSSGVRTVITTADNLGARLVMRPGI